MRLDGKIAVITGASRGIGAAVAKAAAREGARVALVARDTAKLTEVQREIQKSKGEARIFPTDLLDERAVERLAADVEKAWGGIDILFNNAGIYNLTGKGKHVRGLLWEIPKDEWHAVFDIKFTSVIYLCRAFIPGMIAKKQGGKIVNNTGDFRSAYRTGHYYLGTMALEHLTINLAEDLKEFNIQVNAVSPGLTAVDSIVNMLAEPALDVDPVTGLAIPERAGMPHEPGKRRFSDDEVRTMSDPDELANFVIFWMSKEADNVTGQSIEYSRYHSRRVRGLKAL
jgi:NAD(P)-dependent dehydrogenase (short-subunit alcohol dehydrogenase family)